MKKMILPLGLFLFLVVPLSSMAAEPDAILGVWWNQEKDAHIELYKCGEEYCGKIVWLKEPNYPEGSKDGVPGTPKLDHNNSDPALRKTPVIGLQIVYGLSYAGDDRWKGGKIYDPKNGKTYRCTLSLDKRGNMKLRGFIGISLIGRNSFWTRVTDTEP